MLSAESPTSCGLCGRATPPEALHALAVPYLDVTAQACAPCRDDFEAGGRRPAPFEPAFRSRVRKVWPSAPLAADAEAALAAVRAAGAGADEIALAQELARAVASGADLGPLADLDKRVRRVARADATALLLGLHAHRAAGIEVGTAPGRPLSKEAQAWADAAQYEYRLFLPFQLETDLHACIGALHVALRLGRNEAAEAEATLRGYLATAERRPAARDPRLQLLQALLFLRAGNPGGADRAIERAQQWLAASPDRARHADTEAMLLHDASARAAENGLWPASRDALRAYLKLRPKDRAARFDLAHTYMKASLDPVAREVLESALDADARELIRRTHEEDPRDREGRVLYATCLARLGETGKAWALLRDDLDAAEKDPPEGDAAAARAHALLRAERCHLAALCARAEGKPDRPLELLREAYALEKANEAQSRATRWNLVTVLQEEIAARVEALEREGLAELADFVKPFEDALKEEYTDTGLELATWFVAAESERKFAALPGLAPDPIDRARFRHMHASLLQAFVMLAKRRLFDAVRAEREARSAGAAPTPVRTLLALLGRLRGWSTSAG